MLEIENFTDGLTNNLTNATTEAIFGEMIAKTTTTLIIISLALYVLMIIALWKIFKKAGEKSWKALIPIYNTYIMFKIIKMQNWFWALLAVSFVGSLIMSLNGYPLFAITIEDMELRFNIMANPTVLIAGLVLLVFSLITAILYAIRTAKVFDKNGWFAIGLFFLQPIFLLILAFGKADYNIKRLDT